MNSPNNDRKGSDLIASTLDLDRLAGKPTGKKSLSLGELMDVERRLNSGHEVDAEQLRHHSEAQAAMRSAMLGIRTAFAELAEQVRPALAAWTCQKFCVRGQNS